MGSLQRFNLKKYIHSYNVSVLFETGTYKGDGVKYGIDAGFSKIFSTEIMDEFVELNQNQFRQNKNVKILKGNSSELLDKTVSQIDENIFFWLDAHFPGADGGLLEYNSDFAESVKYPLEEELRVIKKNRPNKNDVFLIDDLRIYEDGNYLHGSLPSNIKRPENSNINFVNDLFSDTHHVVKLYEDHGYILLLPKTQKPKIYIKLTPRERISKYLKRW